MVNATELVSKINFVIGSRNLKNKGYIDEFPPLPQTGAQEEEIIKDLVFVYIKKRFPGCRIRQNQHSYSLRLDSHIHRKANKLREIYNNEPEWKQWLENNHNQLYRRLRDSRQSFQSGHIVRKEERNGNLFLYIPFTTNRIYNFIQSGITDLTNWIDNEYQRDERLAEIYGEVTGLIAQETQRREQERLERIRRELEDYTQQLTRNLFKPATSLQESEHAMDRLFANKVLDWARENGKAPQYVVEATVREMVTTGLKVKVMAPPGSEEEGWLALPPFDGYEEPAGYELQGWGKVTAIDTEGERSRHGRSPVVIQDYIYAEFNMEHWKHLLPEGYAELLEVTQRLRQEAETEIGPWLEQERIRKEREEAEERARQEAERLRLEEERRLREEQERRDLEELRQRQAAEQARREEQRRAEREAVRAEEERIEAEAREAEERRHALAEQLRQQLTENPQPVPVPDPTETADALTDFIRQFDGLQAQPVPEPEPEPERARTAGLYQNSRAIPLERYVAIKEDGTIRRFRNMESAIEFLGLGEQEHVNIRDYHAPHELVDVWYNDSYVEEDGDGE